MTEEYLNTVRRLEPNITPIDLTSGAASIAISLKRLADVFEELEELLIGILQAGLKDEPNAEIEAILKRIPR